MLDCQVIVIAKRDDYHHVHRDVLAYKYYIEIYLFYHRLWSTASTHLFNQMILYQTVGINNVNSRTVNKKTTVAVTLTLFLSSKNLTR